MKKRVSKPDDELIQRMLDGRASDAEVDRLGSLIRSDDLVCDRYLTSVDAHACLAEDSAAVTAGVVTGKRRTWMESPIWLVLAATFMVALMTISVLNPWENEELERNFVAVVTNAEGALWEGDDAAVLVGSALEAGVIELCDGRIEMELDSGVQIVMQGPARFELIDENRSILHEGQLSANVPPQAIGFTVSTPGMEVVDLGTTFGVNVTPGEGPQVHVFDGEVEAISTDLKDRELITSELTRRLDQESGQLEEVAFDPERFLPPPQERIPGVEAVFGDVRALRTPPTSVIHGSYPHDYILLFQEQSHVELEDPLEVSFSIPGQYQVGFDEAFGDDFRQRLEPGDRVDSYLLHFDTPSGEQVRCRGSVMFKRPILAVIAGNKQLKETDELLGSWCTEYVESDDRLSPRQLDEDMVVLSCDRKRLTVNWSVGQSVDQIRVLVEADVPSWKRHLVTESGE